MALILCGSISPQVHSHNLSLNTNTAEVAQVVTEQLTPGLPKTGSLPVADGTGKITLGETQYTVEYPGGGVKLVLEFHPDYPMNFFVRRNLPVTIEDNKVVADFGPLVVGTFSLPRDLPIDAATYYIAVRNYSPRAVNFTLIANLVGPPTADTVDLSFPPYNADIFDKLELGSIPIPEADTCSLGRTQYTISLADSVYCSSATGWGVSLRGDRPLKLYARLGQRVSVENGKVVADFASDSSTLGGLFFQSSSGSPAAGVRTYFIAVENCSSNTANYLLSFAPFIADLPDPGINSVFLEERELYVIGYFLGQPSIVLINGEPQKTRYGGVVYDRFFAQEVLIVKKANKKIKPGERVTINVKKDGCTTYPFQYVRPNS